MISQYQPSGVARMGMEFGQNKPLSVCACVYIIKTVMRIHFTKWTINVSITQNIKVSLSVPPVLSHSFHFPLFV